MKKKLLAQTLLLFVPVNAWGELSFDISALESTGNNISEFSKNQLSRLDEQLPGTYAVQIVLNGKTISNQQIRFVECEETLCPVITRLMAINLGLSLDRFEGLDKTDTLGPLTKPLQDYIPGSQIKLTRDLSKLTLDIPQKYLVSKNDLRLASVIQDGVPSLFSSYYYSGQQSRSATGIDSEQHFVRFNNGLNVGPWRIRQNAYLSQNAEAGMQWMPQQTYVGRDIISLMSRLTMGQVSTAGRVFDSFNIKGINLSSIDEMLPDSQQSYGPVIKGIALTQATVEVRQSGTLIYQQDVPAGAFEISDVVPGRTSGDLEVTIRESSGEVRTFIQPYATQPKMVREGQLRYSLNAGTYDATDSTDDNLFLLGEILYGVSNLSTIFGGVLVSNNYQSLASGIGLNMGRLGGISIELDLSKKRVAINNDNGAGYATKINYAKYLDVTGTSLNASLTESLDPKYASYTDYQTRNISDNELRSQPINIRRQWQLSANQSFGKFGSLSLNYYAQKSWDERYRSRTFNTSYSTSWAGVTTSLSLSQSDITNGLRYKDNVVAFNVTVPFSAMWGSPGQARINHSYIQSNGGPAQNQSSVSGTLLRDSNLNYSLSKNWTGEQTGQAARAQYNGGSGSLSAGVSDNSNGSRQVSFGASGSVVAHPGGITLGQSISNNDAFAIVSAPGAAGVSVSTKSGVKTDWRGYAIVPSLTAYRGNNIGLDSTTTDDDTTLNATQLRAVPGYGTAVNASFATSIGGKAWLKILHKNNGLPIGTELNGTNEAFGIVDEKGFAWLTGLTDGERLNAVVDGSHCSIKVRFNGLVLKKGVYTGIVNCD